MSFPIVQKVKVEFLIKLFLQNWYIIYCFYALFVLKLELCKNSFAKNSLNPGKEICSKVGNVSGERALN